MEALQLCLQTQQETKELRNKLQAKGHWNPSGAGETPARLLLPVCLKKALAVLSIS